MQMFRELVSSKNAWDGSKNDFWFHWLICPFRPFGKVFPTILFDKLLNCSIFNAENRGKFAKQIAPNVASFLKPNDLIGGSRNGFIAHASDYLAVSQSKMSTSLPKMVG